MPCGHHVGLAPSAASQAKPSVTARPGGRAGPAAAVEVVQDVGHADTLPEAGDEVVDVAGPGVAALEADRARRHRANVTVLG